MYYHVLTEQGLNAMDIKDMRVIIIRGEEQYHSLER